MEFFKIWQTKGGVIGVNRMTLGELIGANIMVVVVYVILLALLVQLLPIIMLGFYVILLLNNRLHSPISDYDTRQRLMINVLTVISVIYFLVDFHFGWISFSIFSSVISKDSFDSFAILNLSIGLVSVVLFFLGHDLYKSAPSTLGRLGIFILLVFFGFKFCNPISRYFVTNVVTQYNDAELIQLRLEMDTYDEGKTDEERELDRIEQENKEAEKEQEMRDFDKEYAEKYLN